MNNKKTELIGVKVSENLKSELQKIANENEWTLSHLCEKILRDYIQSNKTYFFVQRQKALFFLPKFKFLK